MPIDEELIILRGQKVLRVNKFDYTLHPEAKKLIPSKASEHIPKRSRMEMDQEKKEVMPPCAPSVEVTQPDSVKEPETPGKAKPGLEAIDLNNILSGGNE